MGIVKFNKIVEEVHPLAFTTVSCSYFAGSSIAIDFSILLYQSYSTAFKNIANVINIVEEDPDEEILIARTTKSILSKISYDYVQRNIRPIFILDGETPELKKVHTAPKRKEIRVSAQKRLDELLESLKGNKSLGSSEYNRVVDLKCQAKQLPRDIYKTVVDKLASKGYTILRAANEAEELCTKLCLDGKVKAVFSTDTDNILRRCPIMITRFERSPEGPEFDIAHIAKYTDDIPHKLGLSYESFLDFCIFMGCDYNERIKGSKELDIQTYLLCYKKIERIEDELDIDLGCLNYIACRELLSERDISICCVSKEELYQEYPEYE